MDNHNESKNDEAMRLQLDLIDKVRVTVEQRHTIPGLHGQALQFLVQHKDFQVGDLVLRKVIGAARDPTHEKLGPNQKGPYRITSWQRKGTYHLEALDGRKLHHPWNAEHLQKYYQQRGWHGEQHPFISSLPQLILAILLKKFSIYFSFCYNALLKPKRQVFFL